MFRLVRSLGLSLYVRRRVYQRNFSSESHYKGLKSAMEDLGGGVVPKWSPPTSEVISWNSMPMEELSVDQLTVLARANYQKKPEEIPVDQARAYKLWVRAMELGGAEATYCVAMSKLRGLGTSVDVAAAKDVLIHMSDNNPYAPADLQLAKILRAGISDIGLEPDPELAFMHLVAAADKGLVEAQLYVANAYWAGDGVEQSQINALYWFKAAADGGNRDAKFVLGTVYYRGLAGTDDEENYKAQGWEWYCQAADAGDMRAMFNVGVEYLMEESDFVERDVATAAEWFERSATTEAGYVPAMTNLGNMYRDGLVGAGEGGKRDFESAMKWYKLGAARGDPMCEELLKTATTVNEMS